MKHLCLIDGSGVLFRAYYARMRGRDIMRRQDGTPVNAVFIFTKILLKMMSENAADHMAVVFDAGRKTFRNTLYPDYKANRPDPPEDLIPQFSLVRDATRALNVTGVEMPGFEADDLIATYARMAVAAGAKVSIISSDKDLMQLVGNGVYMVDPAKNTDIGPDEVMAKFGVAPERVVDVQALAGDSTDNVPGVRGIGIKTAADLINQFGDLETLLARAGEIKQEKRRQSLIEEADKARLSRQLVHLDAHVPVEVPLHDMAVRTPVAEEIMGFLRTQEFKSLYGVVESRYGFTAPPPKTQSADGNHAAATPKAHYTLVQDTATLHKWVETIYERGVVAVDTETTSLDALQAQLVGISLCVHADAACYIPIHHRVQGGTRSDGDAPSTPQQGTLDLLGAPDTPQDTRTLIEGQLPLAEVIAILRPVLEDASILKIGQNIKYDAHVLARLGITVAPFDDTMILSAVLESGLGSHGMDSLAERHLNHTPISFDSITGTGKARLTFDDVPLEDARDYAAEDAEVTLRLWQVLKPRLVQEHQVTVYETIERPLVSVLATMERAGVLIDTAHLTHLAKDLDTRMATIGAEIHALAGREFNVASPKQLGEILFEDMNLPGGKKGKAGAWGTGAEVLETLAAEGHTLPARVLEWRQLAKLRSTYTDTLIASVNEQTGRVHTSYSQAGVNTGRLSSSNPNLQNIPIRTEEGRKIREAFIAPEGYVLLSADYSQIELRLLAHIADITPLRHAFEQGLDIHAMTASEVFGVPIEGMDPMIRRNAKAINFGIIYGISAFGLARQLSIPQSQAKAFIEAYFNKFPGIQAYMNDTIAKARTQGYVETIYGRRCHTPNIHDRQAAVRNFAERAAINAPVQGSAADVIKRAMNRLDGALQECSPKTRMLLQVHDELVFEVPAGDVQSVTACVRQVMEQAAHLCVPLVVDVGMGKNWREAHQ